MNNNTIKQKLIRSIKRKKRCISEWDLYIYIVFESFHEKYPSPVLIINSNCQSIGIKSFNKQHFIKAAIRLWRIFYAQKQQIHIERIHTGSFFILHSHSLCHLLWFKRFSMWYNFIHTTHSLLHNLQAPYI